MSYLLVKINKMYTDAYLLQYHFKSNLLISEELNGIFFSFSVKIKILEGQCKFAPPPSKSAPDRVGGGLSLTCEGAVIVNDYKI